MKKLIVSAVAAPTTIRVGTAVQMISSLVLPWIGSPSVDREESAGAELETRIRFLLHDIHPQPRRSR